MDKIHIVKKCIFNKMQAVFTTWFNKTNKADKHLYTDLINNKLFYHGHRNCSWHTKIHININVKS